MRDAEGSKGDSGDAMTAREKFSRLMSPACLDDYGLSMTVSELRLVPEARALVAGIDEVTREIASARELEGWLNRMAKEAAKQMRQAIDDFAYDVIMGDEMRRDR